MGWRKKFFFLSQAGSPFLIYSDFHRQPSYYSTNCLVFTTLGRCANSQQPWIVKTHKEQSQGSPGNGVSLVLWEREHLIGMWAGYCSPLWPLQRRDSGCSWIGVNEVGCHVGAPGKPPPPLAYSVRCRLSWHFHSFFFSCLWMGKALRDRGCPGLQPRHYERKKWIRISERPRVGLLLHITMITWSHKWYAGGWAGPGCPLGAFLLARRSSASSELL